ncbi:MAG: bifunctional glutamate N-acetyltransferase/amino-acid acetyltransferase ArgJ [Vampirovibrio sp.]|nr:bifunctional glutamate N-acetyltransferase/amino-acid acetyltransferase ArgJ [Vampirovibrio sp.]
MAIATETQTQQEIQQTSQLQAVAGGIAAPEGFQVSGVKAGIKNMEKPDVALIVSQVPATVAAMMTTNVVKAAPIQWCQTVLSQQSKVSAIVVNSGNANACTGKQGMVHAHQMAETTASALGLDLHQILVSSTGVIGVPLPIEKVLAGIQNAATVLSDTADKAEDAATAIMTTDTYTKQVAVTVEIGGKIVTIGGIAKGSGMIHPNMATMLAFVTTDADIEQSLLQKALQESVADSYHMISVDGDTSTNDMVAVLANGLAENQTITEENEDFAKFKTALQYVNQTLAQQIAKDGEGATKFLAVTVKGAATKQDAQALGRAVVSSSLVKAAFYGEDANWGRIIGAMGTAGVNFDTTLVSMTATSSQGELEFLKAGVPLPFDEAHAKQVLSEKDIAVTIQLVDGTAQATAWGCDLSHEYVSINGDYRT